MRKKTTGQFYLWRGFAVADNGNSTASVSYHPYKISGSWNKNVALTTIEFSASKAGPVVSAVTPHGVAQTYQISGLTGTPKITLLGKTKIS